MNNAQRKRMKEASDSLSSAIAIIEEVRDEEQDKIDNMPENLQNSARCEELQENVDSLDEIVSGLEDAASSLEDMGAVSCRTARAPARPAKPAPQKKPVPQCKWRTPMEVEE